jgi:hypothetical protein
LKSKYLLLPLFLSVSACTTAFEIGEGLNRLTTSATADPKYLWDIEPASAVAAKASAPDTPPELKPAFQEQTK